MSNKTPNHRKAIVALMAQDAPGAKALAIDEANNLTRLAELPTYSELLVGLRRALNAGVGADGVRPSPADEIRDLLDRARAAA
jgi:uncharacterized protein YlaN (UPF0358 family)